MNQRILLLAKFLDSSGVTTHMFNLAKGLTLMGWEVAIASGREFGQHSYKRQSFESEGIKHFYIPFPQSPFDLKNFIHTSKSLIAVDYVLQQFKPDLIHIHYRSTSPYVLALRLKHRIPCVSTIHMAGMADSSLHKIFAFWGERCISISAETSECLINHLGVPAKNIRLVYNGVDDTYFRPPTELETWNARQKFNLRQEDKVVSIVARLVDTKGHNILIKAIALLRARGWDVIALIAGEGIRATDLIQQAQREGVADLVKFIGHTDSREVFWASDVSILPSRLEGFGLVTVESMLCKVVPVRTPTAGAYEQIQDGVNGFIVPFDHPEALGECLQKLLADNSRRKEMAEAAFMTAKEKFTQKMMLDKTIEVYQEVLYG